MGCSSCKFLKKSDKKSGNVGALYMCTKNKKYVSGAFECDKYARDYTRKVSEMDEIYRDGAKFSNDKSSVGSLLFAATTLILLGLILGVFK